MAAPISQATGIKDNKQHGDCTCGSWIDINRALRMLTIRACLVTWLTSEWGTFLLLSGPLALCRLKVHSVHWRKCMPKYWHQALELQLACVTDDVQTAPKSRYKKGPRLTYLRVISSVLLSISPRSVSSPFFQRGLFAKRHCLFNQSLCSSWATLSYNTSHV